MINWDKGIVNYGNYFRLKRAMSRAAAGDDITVGFIGGSITQGSLSSTPETCYAYRVYQWWKERFEKVRYINAGIGGTTSQFAVARVHSDLLDHRPDVVFVEFSVNDSCTEFFKETYEGLVREILLSGAAVVLIHNICYDSGVSAENVHIQVGRYYDLPSVSIRPTVYHELLSGGIANRDITPDDLHPNDAGHALLAQGITHLLDLVYACDATAMDATLPEPLTENRYQNSTRWQNHNSTPVCNGFEPDMTPQEAITQMFRHGYTAWKEDDSITFQVTGSGIAVQYRKSVNQPTPIACVTIDDDPATSTLLDGNFEETWGDCLYLQTIMHHGENKLHKVEIRILKAHENDVAPFYLVSVIGSE